MREYKDQELEDWIAADAIRNRVYYCVCCQKNQVFPLNGEDTCPECIAKR